MYKSTFNIHPQVQLGDERRDIDYWEKEIEYKKNIISVFEIENKLTNIIKNIKNKKNKEIIDFGCGIGNAVTHIKEFKKIYLVDFSLNMLSQAQNKFKKYKNINFINGNIKTQIIKQVDVILAISSIMPKNYIEFDEIIINFKKNIKKKWRNNTCFTIF
ncbi:MAG: class I SAM-dependent methyltransferase [Campylobacterota bacterium]|nr:class I SAM-dependent methyltransferase [Campylobacterota bacterium]